MIISIIIIGYIGNVFLNRWLNKIWVKECNGDYAMPFIWFFSLAATLILLISILEDSESSDWFTGKNW